MSHAERGWRGRRPACGRTRRSRSSTWASTRSAPAGPVAMPASIEGGGTCKSERTRGRLRAGPFRHRCDVDQPLPRFSRCPGSVRTAHVPDLRLVAKAAVGAPPWFRATALGTCWLGAWAITPGKFGKKVSANGPLPSPAKAEPTPSATHRSRRKHHGPHWSSPSVCFRCLAGAWV